MEALAVKYRPQKFDDVCDQESIKRILEKQIETGQVKNTYLFCGASGCGKAQPLTSKIFTPTGYTTMKDIKVGDAVIDGKGNITKVLGVFPQGKRKTYRIYFNDNTFIDVADNHINSVFRYNSSRHKKEYFEVTTEHLIDLVNSSPYQIRVETPIIDCWSDNNIDIDPYLLGALIGDGSLHNNDAITYEYIEEGQKANELKQQLKNYNLLVKSSEKRIPTNYLYSSVETRTQLLQGLFDTDGYIGKHGDVSISISNKGLAEDIQFLVRSLGMVCSKRCSSGTYKYTYKGVSEIRHRLTTYTIYIKRREDFSFFKCSRKLQRQIAPRFEPRRAISKIEEIDKQECQCIYVESSEHTYLTDNLTVTHNTTIARIFANAINGGVGSPIELDAASNSGVGDVRDLTSEAAERSITSKYKVYIIDECHALSNQAWQAFLKTIEEPPQFTIFIFCTTDPQKIPATILNRVMRFNFNRISTNKIAERLKYISQTEQFTNFNDSCDYISKICSGQMRDAIALLEKCADYDKDLSINNVLVALGDYSYQTMFDLLYAILGKDINKCIEVLTNLYNTGNDMKLFVDKFLEFCLDAAKYIVVKDIRAVKIPASMEQTLQQATTFETADQCYYYIIDRLLELKNMLKNDTETFTTIQVMIMRIARWQ